MAASPADSQPLSPSDFLNLPPTPRLDLDCPALQLQDDDLVLPFISHMLMEEEMDDGFLEQYHPDHPALLQAQQPFADILSDTATATAANSQDTGTGTLTALSPASAAGAPAFINATWPYDPVELLSRTTTYPSAAADSLASPTNNRLNMDMLNQAFLKGMEEASKFLPATGNSLLKPIVSGSGSGKGDHIHDNKLLHQSAANNGSRGGKSKRHDDDSSVDEATGRRSGKLMAAEPEDSETVDASVQNGYEALYEQMEALTLSTDAAAAAGGSKGKKGSGNSDEAVDLRTLLTHCAEAVASGRRTVATDLLSKIRARSSPRGDATQRLAHCFANALDVRLAGGTGIMANSKRTSRVELLRAYQLYLTACCFTTMAFRFSNMAISRAIARSKKTKVHIVDYGEHYGFQWLTLLSKCFWDGRPPKVRITAVDHPQPGFRPAAQIQETGRQLTSFAHQHGVPFRFHTIAAAKWETVSVDDLHIEHDEVLVVNGLFHFGKLMDEGADIDSLSPRDMVLGNIRKMCPDVFVLCVENSSHSAPFFVTRFREALFYYGAMFDMMDALAPRDDDERVVVEQELFGRCAFNAIACEGSDRVERPETYRQWQARSERAGLRQLPLDPDTVKAISDKVKDKYHKDFVVDVDQQWLLQGWKGRILSAMSAWVADDNHI